MAIPKSLLNYLEKNGVKYEIIEHKTAYTALDSSETQHIDPKAVVKTLIMKMDNKGYVLALLPADKNMDKVKFQKAANAWREKNGMSKARKVDFAREVWMKKNLAGQVGATPPFGKYLGLPVFVDPSVLKNAKLVVNTGDYNISILVSARQFEKLEEPVKISFGMAKKIKKPKQAKPKRGGGAKKSRSKKKGKKPARGALKKKNGSRLAGKAKKSALKRKPSKATRRKGGPAKKTQKRGKKPVKRAAKRKLAERAKKSAAKRKAVKKSTAKRKVRR